MATSRSIFWVVLILCFSFIHISRSEKILTYVNTTYVPDPEYVNFTSVIKVGEVNTYFTTYRDLDNFIIDTELYVKTADSPTFSEFSKTTTDVCKILSNAGQNIFVTLMVEQLRRNKRNKIFRKCPVKKGDYYIREYKHDSSNLPAIMPDLEFYLIMIVWENISKKRKLLWLYVRGKVENEVKKQKRPRKKPRLPK